MADLVPFEADMGIDLPVQLTGILSSNSPTPIPPVGLASIPSPTVAPTLVASTEVDGDLAPGTYRYAYAGWRGSQSRITAPSPWAEITITTQNTVTVTYPAIAGVNGYLVYREEV